MTKFDGISRVSLEKHGGELDATIIAELQRIESKAKKERKEGRVPQNELKSEMDRLKAGIHQANQKTAEAYREQVERHRQRHETQRDRKPEAELARIHRAQILVDAMGPSELARVAMEYGDGKRDLNTEEANIIAGKLNTKKTESEYQDFKDAMKTNYANEPWLKDPQIEQLAKESEMYASLQSGDMLVPTAEGRQVVAISDLIDWDDELNQPV